MMIKLCEFLEELYTATTPLSAIYLSGLVFDNEKIRTTGRWLIESMVLAGVTNTTLKFIIGRARPYMEKGNSKFEFFEMKDSYQSLPSGHTRCFHFSSFACCQKLIISIYRAILHSYYHRISTNKKRQDWFSDTVLGAGIGIWCIYSIECLRI